MIVLPIANTALPPDPFSFCIDAFDRGTSRYKGLRAENPKEAIAPVQGRGGVDGLIGARATVDARILSVRTDGFVRIELIEHGLPSKEGHGGRFIGLSESIYEMDGRMSPVDHGEIREGPQARRTPEKCVEQSASNQESKKAAHGRIWMENGGTGQLPLCWDSSSIFYAVKKLKN